MSWSWTLYRYLAVQFFLGVTVVYSAFLVLAFIFIKVFGASAPGGGVGR